MPETLQECYRRLVASGKIQRDSAQELAVSKLQLLSNRLASYSPPSRTDFFSFFTRKRGEVPKGLYIYGAVGRGKTMLMDLFYRTTKVEKKRRAHFHEFMAAVHSRLSVARAASGHADPVLTVASEIASETRLLCLDELFIIDIADATIVARLFTALLEAGVVVVATSNAHPEDLYKNGRNRDLFVPFIAVIEENMEVLQLESARDFRLSHLGDRAVYFTPLDEKTKLAMDALWREMTLAEPCSSERLTVLGHEIKIPCASLGNARFAWADLFKMPLGASDYQALARHYHTIFLDGVPVLSRDRRDEARRFITFIDTLYDQRRGLVVSAEAEPDQLYTSGDGSDHFQRTASRLIEMRSADYFRRSKP